MPKDRELLLYCQKGIRSRQAADILSAYGYNKLFNLSGGYAAWREEEQAAQTYTRRLSE